MQPHVVCSLQSTGALLSAAVHWCFTFCCSPLVIHWSDAHSYLPSADSLSVVHTISVEVWFHYFCHFFTLPPDCISLTSPLPPSTPSLPPLPSSLLTPPSLPARPYLPTPPPSAAAGPHVRGHPNSPGLQQHINTTGGWQSECSCIAAAPTHRTTCNSTCTGDCAVCGV